MATATYALHALIEEARRRALRRRWTYAGLLALLAGGGIWGGLALTSGSGAFPAPPAPPGYHLERARGPVQHALVRGSFRSGLNGYPVGKAAKVRLQVWLDRKTGLIRMRGRWANVRVSDEARRCACPYAFPEILFGRYWPVDTTKFVRRPGIGTFHGRAVIWLGKLSDAVPPPYRFGEWIALDPRTHDAVADRLFGETGIAAGPILDETWVARRFPDIAPNRFWFALKNELDVRFIRFEPVPLYVPGHEPPPDLRHATSIVVGRLGGATIFAAPRRDGFWHMFSIGKGGKVGGGGSRVGDSHTLRVGVVQDGHGGLFSSRAYLVASGSMLAKRGTKLFLVYGDGHRERIKLILAGKPVGSGGLYYYVIPNVQRVRGRRAAALELVRGSRVVARQSLPLPYQALRQPGPLTLKAALQAFGLQVPPGLG
jgi:hypothetical protein